MSTKKLFKEDSEDEEVSLQEVELLEKKYGSKALADDVSSSGNEDDDDVPPEVSEEVETQFLKTLPLLKNKDPLGYDPNFKAFEESEGKKEVKTSSLKYLVFEDSDSESSDDGNIFKVEKKAEISTRAGKKYADAKKPGKKDDGEEPMRRKRAAQLHRVLLPAVIFEDVELEVIDQTADHQPQPGDVVFASTSGTSIGITDEHFETTTAWINILPTNCNSDDEDLNVDYDETDGIDLLRAPPRTATDEIADNADLSPAQVAILQQEEQLNDRQIRELASTDDYLHFTWTNDRQTFTGKREKFLGTPGPTFPVTDKTRPIDIFYKMFTSDFIDMLVTETNRYAEQNLDRLEQDTNAKKSSRLFRWTPTNRDEMLAYLAINILQGLYPKPVEQAYFSYDGFGTTPYFKFIMSYNRYYLLKTFQHFVDNETSTDTTKLNKIQPVISYLNDRFSSLYKPGQEIAIDESLLKWLGRLSFSQKISTKAAQVGVKTYELCESSTGYLWSFIVYTGKDRQNRTDTDGANDEQDDQTRPDNSSSVTRPTNATAKIVYKLVEPLLHKGHTLIMDNFYNSPLLARCLKRDGQTDVYGTLRLSREFVPKAIRTLKKSDLRQGEVAATYSSDLSVMVWRDSNLVSMISTFHSLEVGKKDNSDRQTYKPVIVLDYNKSMGGVDRKDQFLAGQPLERQRNKIWYKKLFRRLYNAALFNCFVIFTSNRNHKLSHRQFRTVLAEDLLKIHRKLDLSTEPRLFAKRGSEKKPLTSISSVVALPTRTTTTELPRLAAYVESNHFPGKSASYHTSCRMCKKHRTSYKCIECNVPLCILKCFQQYHKGGVSST